ncbi:hypothetical protein M427DRAFT_34717 [Gonapodya prolifera JEL478]|uniref:Uncharacterized protein n=1 Tax=Gonapodya prolifera (strain JEL478) TaxID=1344416 RepID=A0A139A785_GONPJ|nr:hypothetical protein M427DRAFT_34717 [Gonapodya prolifera JEL478]|eukprot:KXS12529.1 hypothetical protein M427DRAFT_34717 [Gonapodya prolifera JEL478]
MRSSRIAYSDTNVCLDRSSGYELMGHGLDGKLGVPRSNRGLMRGRADAARLVEDGGSAGGGGRRLGDRPPRVSPARRPSGPVAAHRTPLPPNLALVHPPAVDVT